MSELEEVKFEKYIFGGECLGKISDGRTVFTPFVLAGEIAKVRPYFTKKGYVKAELDSITLKSSARIDPPCKNFSICGGCHYQNTDYLSQLRIKQTIIEDQLKRIGGIMNPPLNPIIPSEKEFNYRNSIQFQVTSEGKLGFYSQNGNYILPVDECHLPSSGILENWLKLNLENFPGLKRVQFREGTDGEQMIILECNEYSEMPEIEVDFPVSIIHLSSQGLIVLAGDDHLIYEVLQRPFKVSAGSFFQVNSSLTDKLVNLVLEYLPKSGNKFLELYCGVGLFTAFLAPRFKEIIAIEENESACDDFVVNLDEFDNISLYVGATRDVLPGIKEQFDYVLLDPPRSGIDELSMKYLLEQKIPLIVYVSCDIATLSRDLKKFLSIGYNLIEITPLDMFPQTYHIECVAKLSLPAIKIYE
jgi:23S rRNA (uracil1939-C5)-methyltransferase